MATKILGMSRKVASLCPVSKASAPTVRTAITSAQGEILSEPVRIRFGIPKVLAAAVPGIFVGATLAKNGAAWLEENEIFIPDDDDDD